MEKEWKERWVIALRSDKFKQGSGCLYDEHNNTFCCLGVLREIVEPNVLYGSYRDQTEEKENTVQLDNKHAKGLTLMEASILGGMNDEGKTFPEIADYIEQNISGEELNLCL